MGSRYTGAYEYCMVDPPPVVLHKPETKENISIMRELRAYLAEHRDLLFTVAIIAIVVLW